MKRKLPPWCKEVKKILIDKDMTVTELADVVNISRPYVSRVVNGSTYAPEIASRISRELEVDMPYTENIL